MHHGPMAANDVTEPAVQALIAGGKISRFETGQATP